MTDPAPHEPGSSSATPGSASAPTPGATSSSAPGGGASGPPSPLAGAEGSSEAALLQATEDARKGFDLVAAEDEAEDQGPVRRAGEAELKLVGAIGAALRIVRLHSLDNHVAQEVLKDLHTVLGAFLEKREKATLIRGDERLIVNGAALRMKRSGSAWLHDFIEYLARMGIYGLVFRGTFTEAAIRQLVECFHKIEQKTPEERVRAIAANAAKLEDPAHVDVLDLEEARAYLAEKDDADLTDTERAIFYYARLQALAEASHVAVVHGRSPDFHVRHLRQTFMKIIEFLRAGLFEVRLLGLTAMPLSERDPMASHAANVAVLSVAMGRLLGLERGALADVGFAAFFHDLGRAGTGRKAKDGAEDMEDAHDHVNRGVAYSLRAKGFSDAGLLRIIVAHEHHRKTDRYPHATGLRSGHLAGRIVSVADAFDKLEHGTPWSKPQNPARVMTALRAEPNRYEYAIVGLLRDVVGTYPRGSLVKTEDGSLVVVVDGGARRGDRPVARRLLLPNKRRDLRGVLREIEVGKGELVDPETVGFDWKRVLIA